MLTFALAQPDPLYGIGLPIAFAAGLVSFLSPCVLPLAPAYAACLGSRVRPGPGGARLPMLASGIAFVAGLSIVFVALFYLFASVLQPYRHAFAIAAGVFVILMALQVSGLLRLPYLMGERRLLQLRAPGGGPGGAFLLGASFAMGWTPCIGATLGAVLSAGVVTGISAGGVLLMFAYCLGLGAPFLLLAITAEGATRWFRSLARWRRALDLSSATLLLVMGTLLLTDRLTLLTAQFAQLVPHWLARLVSL